MWIIASIWQRGLGLFITLLPTWGDKFNIVWGQGPEIFTPENAAGYGAWIGRRFRDRWNIIWMLGGDRPLTEQRHQHVIDALARGIRQSDPNHLMTFHPVGGSSSLDAVPGRDWLDFHTVQTGHGLESYRSFELLAHTRLGEEKPFMDAEPRYEDHPACFNTEYGYFWMPLMFARTPIGTSWRAPAAIPMGTTASWRL